MIIERFFRYILPAVLLLFIAVSCDNLFILAEKKNFILYPKEKEETSEPAEVVYPQGVSNFVSVVGTSSVFISWRNPSQSIFNGVKLLRKTGGYPSSHDDAGAATVYEGTGTTFTDSSVVTGTTYYYSLYTISDEGVYSQSAEKTYKTVVTFNKEIRDRCFYLIGGSSSYTDNTATFSNLITEIDAFDPSTDIVYPNIASIPHPRYSCAAASAGGKIFIFGGLDENKIPVKEVDILDISNPIWPANSWSEGTAMPIPRFSLRAENVNGQIFVLGGASGYHAFQNLMSNKAHMYNPNTDTWLIDDNQLPILSRDWMNFSSGSYNGVVYYGFGRYSSTFSFLRYLTAHIFTSNSFVEYDDTPGGTDNPSYAAIGGVVFYKDLPASEDILLFIGMGGCTNTGTTYEPLRQTNGTALIAANTCFYARFPNTGAAADTFRPVGQVLSSARAYCEAEYCGDYVYVFCGIANGGTVLSSIEKLYIDDTGAFPSAWQSVTSTGMSQRFAFDITKVNY